MIQQMATLIAELQRKNQHSSQGEASNQHHQREESNEPEREIMSLSICIDFPSFKRDDLTG